MCVCVYACTCDFRFLLKTEESIRCHKPGIRGDVEHPLWGGCSVLNFGLLQEQEVHLTSTAVPSLHPYLLLNLSDICPLVSHL